MMHEVRYLVDVHVDMLFCFSNNAKELHLHVLMRTQCVNKRMLERQATLQALKAHGLYENEFIQ